MVAEGKKKMPVTYPDITRWVPCFAGFTQFTPAIPKLYWDVKSQEQRILAIFEQIHKLICYSDMLGDKINITHEEIDALNALFEKFIESGFEDYYEAQIQKWIDEHMEYIISQAIKMVFFGLTTDGYFCAYIPRSWEGIIFDTVSDYASDNYGCLTLSY